MCVCVIISDLPSILSGDHVAFLDPHGRHFIHGETGMRLPLCMKETLDQFPDQFTPYINPLFGCSQSTFEDKHFAGTIFRFPLRNKKSELSDENFLWDDKRVEKMFESFKLDAGISPLFLKSVRSISFYEKSSIHENPKLLFTVTASEAIGPGGDGATLQLKRKELLQAARLAQSVHVSWNMNVKVEVCGGSNVETSKQYLTVNTMKTDGISPEFQALIRKLKLLPWAGVSMLVDAATDADCDPNGRLFCFLPLPVDKQDMHTGLPVHIHGYFGLGEDRRNIDWPSEGTTIEAARWNKLLVDEIFPQAYVHLIETAVQEGAPAGVVYRAWPKIAAVKDNWKNGVKNFLQDIKDKNVIYSSVNGGTWLKPSEVYIEPTQNEIVRKVLERKGYSVPTGQVPQHVLDALRWAEIETKHLSPKVVREAIRGESLASLTHEDKMHLLLFILDDADLQEDKDLQDLNNIHLLPLADGSFTKFCSNNAPVYIPTDLIPSDIFPNMTQRFVAEDLPSILKKSPSCHQLKILTCEMVPEVLKEALPRDWTQVKDVIIKWIPGGLSGGPQQPEHCWLERFWNWLRRQTPTMIYKFDQFPLVELERSDGCHLLAKLKKNLMIYSSMATSSHLSESMMTYLKSLGIVVIQNDLPEFIKQHPYIDKVVLSPDINGVAAVLEANWCKLAIDNVANDSNGLKDEIRQLFSQGVLHLHDGFKKLLSQLPIFVSTDGKHVTVAHCRQVLPHGLHGVPVKKLRSKYLIERDEYDSLAIKLGAERITKDKLINTIVKDIKTGMFYTSEECLEFMNWLLQIPDKPNNFDWKFSFVPTDSGLQSPDKLFPPDDDHLMRLFKGKPVFPVGELAQGNLLNCLKNIGMRNASSVTASELLDIAVTLPESQDIDVATALLEHITENSHLLHEKVSRNRIDKPFGKFLQDRCWVPCQTIKPESYPESLEWKGSTRTLHRPEDVELPGSANILGSVKPLVNLAKITDEFREFFCWSELSAEKYNTVKDVTQHLQNVIEAYPQLNMQAVSRIVEEIYSFLNKSPDRHLKNIFTNSNQPIIWHGSGFTTPDKVTITRGNINVNLAPYLFTLPETFHDFRNLFCILGVQEEFNKEALSEVLVCIQQKHIQDDISDDDKKKDIRLVCDILNSIVAFTSPSHSIPDILVPCREAGQQDRLKMVLSSKCLYVDEERLLDEYNQGLCEEPVVHQMVPNELAKRLHLRPLSHSVAPVDNLDLGYEIEGPHQSTVNAIKRNLEMYKEGLDVFKEIIQNADDAGATEVKFLIDWRENLSSKSKLLSDGMEMCHGPALWAYNNAKFSDKDIDNICNIAAASKKEYLDKIGRVGLGFTSVYHITDVPSIVSGSYVMIFDPRTNHLGTRVNAGRPGVKLDITKERHKATLRSYPNQFQPFQGIFGCDMSQSTPGYDNTLFRLPLRTPREAKDTSQDYLSEAIYDSQKMDEMVRSLKESASSLLLFTQNVTHVKVQALGAESSPTDEYETLLDLSVSCVKTLASRCIEDKENSAIQRQILMKTSERMQSEALSVPESTCILKVTEKAQVTTTRKGKKEKSTESFFVVSSCMATGRALDLALSEDGKKAGVLPCGGVAVQLESGMEGKVPVSCKLGSAFSYLPLNVVTGLPFHINGNFLLQPNRRHLWSKTSSASNVKHGGEFESRWNICLMEEVLGKAIINLLHDLQVLQQEDFLDARQFQTVWPRLKAVESDFHPLVEAFYKQISNAHTEHPLIYNGNRWVGIQDCFFLHESLIQQDVHRSIIAILNEKLSPKKWVYIEDSILKSMSAVHADEGILENTFDLSKFLKEIFFPIMNSDSGVQPNHRNKVVLHLLDLRLGTDKQTQYDDDLKKCECIPVSSDQSEDLVMPSDLVHPRKSVGRLFDESECRFPYGDEYQREERLLSLEGLGMATGDLAWKDICEVAECLGKKDLSKEERNEKTRILLKLIDNKLLKEDMPSEDQVAKLQNSAFLPVLNKPSDYPLEWYTTRASYMSASQLFEAKHSPIIGSVQPLLDEICLGDALTERLLAFLGINQRQVHVEDVIKQLHVAIRMTEEQVPQGMTNICHKIYSFLNATLCPSDHQSVGNAAELLDELKHLPLVLVERRFLKCDQVAFKHSRQNGRYLFPFPEEFDDYRRLFKSCGVRETFEIRDFISVLSSLKQTYQDRPLPPNDISVAVDMLSALAEEPGILDHRHHILVPDSNNILKQISLLTYNDIPWEREREDLTYPHRRITLHEAHTLGMKTCRQLHLESCSSREGFESPFGQSEELTNRLKGILQQYSHVPDVIKELLQNADDARATEIHFVHDPREHKAEHLVGYEWADIHKLPALCVYNNKGFSQADLEGIQKVGVGGKLTDTTTTGRFGIGFNATYHLTDCPTFVSNNQHLCVFDPHFKYVPGATRENPGMMYKVDGEDGVKAKFPDMISGYLGDKFNLEGATMFRFPLRSAQMARESNISTTSFTQNSVEKLLGTFQSVARETLLFLNHIKKISISVIDSNTGELLPKYVVKSFVDMEGEAMREELAEHLMNHKDHQVTEIPPMHKVYRMEIEDKCYKVNREKKESWLVSQTIGLHSSNITFQDDMHLRTKTHLPRGGAACLLHKQESNTRSYGSGAHGSSQPSEKRYKAFCFLPLPIYTGLPIHVNGTFVLDPSRQNLVRGDEFFESNREGAIHKWNRLLVMHVIAPAYAYLIEKAGRILLDPKLESFQSEYNSSQSLYDKLFPMNVKEDGGEWSLLGKSTLQYITSNSIEVLPVIRESDEDALNVEWYHPNSRISEAFFDNLAPATSLLGMKDQEECTTLRRFLLSTGFRLLSSSPEVCNTFTDAEVEADFVTSKPVLQHLLRLACTSDLPIPCSVEDSAFKSVGCCQAVLKYCLNGIEGMQLEELKDIPLCLTNDSRLASFTSANPPFLTDHVNVLPRLPQCFIHKDLVWVIKNWPYTRESGKVEECRQQMFQSGLLKDFTIYDLSAHIGSHLPQTWQGQNQHVEWTPGTSGHPDEEWLKNLWEFILLVGCDDGPEKCMQVLRDWPIIPTHQGTLVSSSHANTVLFLDTFVDSENRKKLVQVLRKSQCPEVDLKQMYRKAIFSAHPEKPPEKLIELLQTHMVVPTSQAQVLRALQYFQQTELEKGKLSKEDAQVLLMYFQEGCGKFTRDEIRVLKGLPIFPTRGGELIEISKYRYCHTMSQYSNVPDCQKELWMAAADCIFLEDIRKLQMLNETLEISNMSLALVYINYILPNFNVLDMDSKMKYMEHVRDGVLKCTVPEEIKAQLIHTLRRTPFICREQGCLYPAEYFFYPHDAVFKIMKDSSILQHRFLPQHFCTCHKWLSFLSEIGLIYKVTPALFIAFAKEIEQTAAAGLRTYGEVIELKEKSKVLCCEIDKNDSLKNETFLSSIADIKFIPSVPIDQDLLQIHPAPADTTTFIAYRGSVAEYDRDLVWSVAKLLPEWAIPAYEYLVYDSNSMTLRKVHPRTCLGIGMKATLDKVLSHTQNICDHMAQRNRISEEDNVIPTVREKFKAIMKQVYQFLTEAMADSGEEMRTRLRHTPICLVDDGHVLVRASQMVQRLNEQKKYKLKPYIYETASDLVPFYHLFSHLGTTDNITFDQLAGVLAALRQECIDTAMSPNERKTAHAAVYLMFTLLKHTHGKCTISVKQLYLPTPDNHLMLSTDLYYADDDSIGNLKLTSTDVKFIVPLKQCGLKTENESKLIELLPAEDGKKLRPLDLKMKMSEKPCNSNKECEAENDCQYLKHVKKMTTSEEMQRVLYRLIRHQNKGNPLTEEPIRNIATLRQTVHFKCFRKLNTGFYDVHGKEIMVRNKSRRVFLLKEETNMFCLYLEHVDHTCIPPQAMQHIAEKINSACGIELSDKLKSNLAVVLASCQDVDDMNIFLTEEYDIPEYDDAECGGIQPDMHRPGLIVPMDTRHLLVDSMINLFHPGETAAYRRPLNEEEDSCDSEDTQMPELSAAIALPHHHTQQGESELIYVEILERLDTEEGIQQHDMQRKYKIDIGTDEPIIVGVALLYKFRRPRPPGETTIVPFEGDPEAEPPLVVNEALPEDLEEAQGEIRKSIQVALTLAPRERREVVRRLYRQWHPDRNMDQQTLATPAFQFLMAEMQRVGLRTSQQWDSEISRERQEERRYQEEYFRRRHDNGGNNASFVPPSFSRETPDPRSGRLWFRQAEEDFQAVLGYQQSDDTNFAFVAFMIHQTVEKALKAAQYSQNGRPNLRSNDLRTLVRDVCGHPNVDQAEELENSVSRIIRMECDFTRSRYPESRTSRTSRDLYVGFRIDDTVVETRKILEIVRNIVGIHVY